MCNSADKIDEKHINSLLYVQKKIALGTTNRRITSTRQNLSPGGLWQCHLPSSTAALNSTQDKK
jgi:hypothetical protein